MGTLSVRAFARRKRVSHVAVLKAIRGGRLKRSVGRRGRTPFIADVALADREWRDNASREHQRRPTTKKARAATADAPPSTGPTLNEATRLVTLERQKKLERENETAAGRLVEKNIVVKEAFEAARIIREAMLNLPARLAGELAAESDAGRVFARLDAAIREALSATADALQATVNE